jgi:large subunit ribosomal protein L9
MEVILRSDVDKVGQQGQIVKVAPGFARNYLLPQGLAVAATASNKKIVDQQRQATLRKEAKVSADARELATMMGKVDITIHQKAGEEDQLFGSVTSQDIQESLEKQGYKIDRKKIVLDHPIKTLGEHKVTLKLHRDVSLDIPVHVLREETA